MKTKLLSKLRNESREHIGVFNDKSGYMVIFDKHIYLPDLQYFNPDERHTKDSLTRYQILEENVETLDKAKDMCDFYRRNYILQQLREMRYKNRRRVY